VKIGFGTQTSQPIEVYGPAAVQVQRLQQRIQFDSFFSRLVEEKEVAEGQLLGIAQLQRERLFELFVVESRFGPNTTLMFVAAKSTFRRHR
jgi:hypothetical protein